MKVNIIYPLDGWILNKMGEELINHLYYTKGLPYKFDGSLYPSDRELNKGDINYFIHYAKYKKTNLINAAWFTHPADERFEKIGAEIDYAICNCEKHRTKIKAPSSVIIPGIDKCFKSKLVLGFAGRFYPCGRKGENLLDKIKQLDFVDLKITNGNLTRKQMPNFYNAVDYVIVTSSLEGGPMCILEAASMGKKTICPLDVGFASSFTDVIIPYKKSNWKSLKQVLWQLYNDKTEIRSRVSKFTWHNWAKEHNIIFESLIRKIKLL